MDPEPTLLDAAPRAPLAERALAQRVRAVPPSGIRRFFDILATMDDVISLGVGEPDFDTPRVVVEAGVESLREGRTHYGLNALGLAAFEPRGAFRTFPRITSTGLDDETFTERLLTEERVAVVPGSAFGPSGAGHVRMCYATEYEGIEEALVRIGRFVDRCRTGWACEARLPPSGSPSPGCCRPAARDHHRLRPARPWCRPMP